jgi:hypothetical protein
LKYRNRSLTLLMILCFVLVYSFVGCSLIKPHVQHPGTANSFDSDAYDALLVTDAIIKQTKTDYANNAFPPNYMVNIKTALNNLIIGYDDAQRIYLAYHNAAIAGTATTTQSDAVANSLNNLKVQTAALTNAKAGK